MSILDQPTRETPPPIVALLATAIRLNMATPKPSPAASASLPVAVAGVSTTPLDRVRAVVKQLGKASPHEIRLHLGAPRTTVARALKALERSGALRATGNTNNRQYMIIEQEVVS